MKYMLYVIAELDPAYAQRMISKFEAMEASGEIAFPFDADSTPQHVLEHAQIVGMTLTKEVDDGEMN